MVTADMYQEVKNLFLRIRSSMWSPVTNPPWFAFLGAEGFSSDAVLHVVKDPAKDPAISAEGGRGVHLFRTIAGAAWSSSTKPLIASKRLSINPLELLTTAAAVVFLGTHG